MNKRELLSAARNPAEAPQVEAVATALSEIERDLHAAVQEHYDVLGAEVPADLPPTEDRVEQFKRLVSHQTDGDLWGYFCKEQAPEDLQNTDLARKHAGTDREEWEETVEEWAANIRELKAEAEEMPDRDVADTFCKDRFGVPLDVFESAVVRYTDRRTLRMATRGRLDVEIRRIEAATAALEDTDAEADVEEPDPEPEPDVEGAEE